MIKSTRREISPVMLENEIRKRHMTLDAASKKMGYNGNYLSVSMNRGFITRPAMVLLEQLFNIKEEDIMTPTANTVDVVEMPQVIDWHSLYNTVYSAVKNAMIDALNNDGCKS